MRTRGKKLIPTAKTINSRICFANKFSKLGILHTNRESIQILPNFSVKDAALDLSEMRPEFDKEIIYSIGNQTFQKRVKHYVDAKNHVPGDLEFSNAIKSTGQLLIINLDFKCRAMGYETSYCSFSVVNFAKKDGTKILTTLHSFNMDQTCFETILIFNFSELDLINELNAALKVFWRKTDSKIRDKNREVHSKFVEDLISSLNKEFENSNFVYIEKLKDNLDNDFLMMRREMIIGFSQERCLKKNILLDPEFNLQTMPSIDAAIFNISDSLAKLLEKKGIKGLELAEDSDLSDMDQMLFAIGFNDNSGKLDEGDYAFTLFCDQNLIQEGFSNCEFVNSDKSVSFVKIKFTNDYMFTNISSLMPGSSGAPIVNNKGKLFGMSIAYYSDKTEYDEAVETEDLLKFDKNSIVEQKENYGVAKNSNIALSINHKIFMLFTENLGQQYSIEKCLKMKNYNFPELKKTKIAEELEKFEEKIETEKIHLSFDQEEIVTHVDFEEKVNNDDYKIIRFLGKKKSYSDGKNNNKKKKNVNKSYNNNISNKNYEKMSEENIFEDEKKSGIKKCFRK